MDNMETIKDDISIKEETETQITSEKKPKTMRYYKNVTIGMKYNDYVLLAKIEKETGLAFRVIMKFAVEMYAKSLNIRCGKRPKDDPLRMVKEPQPKKRRKNRI